MSELSIANVVVVSISEPPAGLSDYQVNNLLLTTRETPVVPPTNGSFSIYLSPADVATDWGTASEAYAMANLIFGQSPNVLSGGGRLIIAPQGAGEVLADAIARLNPLVFFGAVIWGGYAPNDAEVLAAALVVTPLRRMLFCPNHLVAALNPGGLFAEIKDNSYHYARGLLYTTSAADARLFAAAYAGRALSTAFSGSATTQTLHLKDLVGIDADEGITQTTLELAETIGADLFIRYPLPKIFSTGGNHFFDQVYNLEWFVFALQVAGFNALATTSTKIPQTEPGMAILRAAYLEVLQRAVINGYAAPGQWNSPNLFGNPEDLRRNVLQAGFYLYSQPVNRQSQTDRALRKAPLIQIALKEAGAIHSTEIVVEVEA